MPSNPPDFSAAPSALGYLHQVRYALVLLLQARAPDTVISIEKIDDVAFEDTGEPSHLLQLKHHITHTANLTDSSTDLWKTLRVWATKVADGALNLPGVILSLVTTAEAPAGSAAQLLRDGPGRNEAEALRRLKQAGAASGNATVRTAFASFEVLSAPAQEELFSRIRVLDMSPDIEMARHLLQVVLRYSTKEKFLTGFCDRLEGWWFRRAIQHLKDPQSYPGISWREAQAQIEDLAEQFRLDNLPIDFPTELDMEEGDLPADERLFVESSNLSH